jgi:hypothetical protein
VNRHQLSILDVSKIKQRKQINIKHPSPKKKAAITSISPSSENIFLFVC